VGATVASAYIRTYPVYKYICHTAIENLSDPIGYLLDFTNPIVKLFIKYVEELISSLKQSHSWG
jgi:hypothetical protein